jgi:hypothetical protein
VVEFDRLLDEVSAQEQIKMLNRVAREFGAPLHSLRLYSADYEETIRDSRRLVANDLAVSSAAGRGDLVISWVLACGSDVDAALERADLVESTIVNSSLAGFPVLRWQVCPVSLL